MNKDSINIVWRLLCGHKFSLHLDKYQGTVAGSYGKNIFSFVIEECILSSTEPYRSLHCKVSFLEASWYLISLSLLALLSSPT